MDNLLTEGQKLLLVYTGLLQQTIDEMVGEGALVVDHECCYLPNIYKAERYCEKRLNEVIWGAGHTNIGVVKDIIALHDYLTEDQAIAVTRAASNSFSVITGLPGTGKTLVTKVIVDVLKRLGYSYALSAPTGKAARRLEQASGIEAKTIHRLLEYVPHVGFTRNNENPLEVDYVIVDEASMVDIFLMATFLDAIKPGGRVVMIGDVDQLPSVGPGSVLRDLIAGNVCWVTKLVKIHRQAEGSGIIRVAHEINRGECPGLSAARDSDAVQISENNDQEIRKQIITSIKNGEYATEDVQVLSPMKRGSLGIYELNKLLQAELNPHVAAGKSATLKGFYLKDRVMHLVNNYDKSVFNGEVGYVVAIDQDNAMLTVDYEGKIITYEEDELDEVSLAYAITVHKSQGSQFPCVIIPLHGQHYVMLKRQLLYTAVTRAQSKLIVAGASKFLAMAAKNNKEEQRFTGLFKAFAEKNNRQEV
jgi:exodeoxyribonuclease V alpha subunit